MRTRDIRSVVYLSAGLGLIIAIYTYLETVEAGLQKYCTVNSFVSCGAVANSGNTTTFGIPDSFIGIGGFILVLALAGIAENRKRELLWPYLLLLFTTAGVGFSLYFLVVELSLIHALCPVCLAAWVFGWIAWVASIFLVLRLREKARARAAQAPAAKGASAPGTGSGTGKGARSSD
jgi:uncharacterized membrane protein